MPEELIAATAGSEITQNVAQNSAVQVDTGDTGHAGKTFTQAQLDEIVKGRLDKERQRLEGQYKSDPRLSFVETQAKKYGMTTEQYLEAVAKAEEEEKLNELVQQNIPQEYAKKLLEHDKIINEYQSERQANQQKEAKNKMYQEFLDAYPDVNPMDIPPEVWQEVKTGRSLTDAYTRHENKLLREKLDGVQSQQQTQQANQKNAVDSTGSAKSGKATQGFISKETFEQNRKNQKWMDANYDNLTSSMKHW
jgi:hypothetical protein